MDEDHEPDEHNLFIGARSSAPSRLSNGPWRRSRPERRPSAGLSRRFSQGGDRLRFVFSAAVAHQVGKELAAPGILQIAEASSTRATAGRCSRTNTDAS